MSITFTINTGELLDTFSVVTKAVTTFSMLVSVPIYISVVVFIIANNHSMPFQSPFYTCYIALAVADLVSYFLYLFKKSSYWGWIPAIFLPADEQNGPGTFLYFLIWQFAFAQFQMNILISVNRFFSIVFPNVYFKYWTHKFNRILISLIYGVSTAFALPIFRQTVLLTTTTVLGDTANYTRITGPVFLDTNVRNVYNTAWKVHIYLILSVCVICYSMIFWRIRNMDPKSKSTRMKLEIRMFYALLVLLVANIFYCLYFFARDYLELKYQQFGRYSEWTLYLLADIYDLHNPFGLLITSKKVRDGTLPFGLIQWLGKGKTPTRVNPILVKQRMQPSYTLTAGNRSNTMDAVARQVY